MTLSYEDTDWRSAERILGYFIDDLREKLRQEQVRSASGCAKSLQEAAGTTLDTLLQTQLYLLIAQQLESEKVAEVHADHAFSVLQQPRAPDRPLRPEPLMYSLVAATLAVIGVSALVIMRAGFVS